MIPFFIAKQFNAKIIYLLSAIFEQKYGRVPTERDIATFSLHTYQLPGNNSETFCDAYLDDDLWLSASIREHGEGEAFSGDFEAPESIINDEFVQQKLLEWKN